MNNYPSAPDFNFTVDHLTLIPSGGQIMPPLSRFSDLPTDLKWVAEFILNVLCRHFRCLDNNIKVMMDSNPIENFT